MAAIERRALWQLKGGAEPKKIDAWLIIYRHSQNNEIVLLKGKLVKAKLNPST
jgi:hypothetical protein